MKKIIGSMLLSIGLLSAGVVSNIIQIGDTVEDRIENTASMTQMDAVGGQPYTMPTSTSTATSETTIDLNLGGGEVEAPAITTIVFSNVSTLATRKVTGSGQTLCYARYSTPDSCVTYSGATGLWSKTGSGEAFGVSSDLRSFTYGRSTVTIDTRNRTVSISTTPYTSLITSEYNEYSVVKSGDQLCFRIVYDQDWASCIAYRFQ